MSFLAPFSRHLLASQSQASRGVVRKLGSKCRPTTSTFVSFPSPLHRELRRNLQTTRISRRKQEYIPLPPKLAASTAPRKFSERYIGVFIVGIVITATGAFLYLLNQKKAQPKAAIERRPKFSKPASIMPAFSPQQVSVIFVLGGPGAGKGTQCASLVRDFGFVHLSAGDLLRAEQERPGSQYGDLIKDYIKDGKIVPMEVTVALLENAMRDSIKNNKDNKHASTFLIDGFPRQMDQFLKFEESVVPARFTLFFDAPEEVLEKRLLKRGETSGRSDDNLESIKKRFKTFEQTSMPVVTTMDQQGRVLRIDSRGDKDAIYKELKQRLVEKLKDSAPKTS